MRAQQHARGHTGSAPTTNICVTVDGKVVVGRRLRYKASGGMAAGAASAHPRAADARVRPIFAQTVTQMSHIFTQQARRATSHRIRNNSQYGLSCVMCTQYTHKADVPSVDSAVGRFAPSSELPQAVWAAMPHSCDAVYHPRFRIAVAALPDLSVVCAVLCALPLVCQPAVQVKAVDLDDALARCAARPTLPSRPSVTRARPSRL